ncbi:MAG TPA: TIM barrel protein [Candidatus Paceibacterota bacterium]|nr:sugar phosphate isomerase/epimerase [Verrucomicrobiota bacterium]HOX03739.1 TIM barrel protein [Verrucomicrobiota bacterium]HRZ46641.1 TIM barrel protein [Candidatus Paceibacterota bacterium]HRZ91299.1 TIM barrel protein [Candidatus Paceibacterota bacterium]
MYYTGIADEAGALIDTQIRATRELGWDQIEARMVEVPGYPKANIHDLPEPAFEAAAEKLEAAGVRVCCFGSAIGNWAKKIDEPFDSSLEEARRAIPRMQRLGTRLIRIMSFAIREGEDQMAAERFRRVRELTEMFLGAGIQPVHENCMNYGGMGWPYMLELLENVPGLKVVFDTGNPVFNLDRSKPKPWPRQDAWEFFEHVRDHIVHVHIKDAKWDPARNEAVYTYPGEGEGCVKAILRDLLKSGYDGGLSIEPHLAVVFHDDSVQSSAEAQYGSYVEYGRRLMRLVEEARGEVGRA